VQLLCRYLRQVFVYALAVGQLTGIKAMQHAPAPRMRAGLLQTYVEADTYLVVLVCLTWFHGIVTALRMRAGLLQTRAHVKHM
jgi:hypothetical protein